MKVELRRTINKPASEVWQVLGRGFESAGEWMSAVNHSYAFDGEPSIKDAPCDGRVCELSTKKDGPAADEKITHYDDEKMELGVLVTPKGPSVVPVVQNELFTYVVSLTPDSCEVVWQTNVTLKAAGYVLYPMIKAGLSKVFKETLEELDHYVVNGTPHPRKVKKMNKVVATAA